MLLKKKRDGWVYQWQLGISSSDLDEENSNVENQVHCVFSFHIFHFHDSSFYIAQKSYYFYSKSYDFK